MTFADLPPTQQNALHDAREAPLQRVRGGYALSATPDDVHTVRSVNALERNGFVEFSTLRGVAFITGKGRAVIDSAAKAAA
jgi:hypothetical protein